MSLTPADVHNVAFSKPPIGKRGYNEDEVDAFLDLVETELARLIEENNDLRQQVEQLDAQLETARSDLDSARSSASSSSASLTPPRAAEEPRRLAPVPPPSALEQTAGGADGGDHHVQAAKVLGLAQEMADRLTGEAKAEADGMVTEARTKAEQLLSDARSKSDSMVNEARTRAETMLNDARTRAETLDRQAREKATSLEREAQRKHNEVMSTINAEKTSLEKKIEKLRTFEREYRTRLKGFLEAQLRELSDRGSAAPSSPPSNEEGHSASASSGQGYSFGPRAAEAG
ncbi:DivIVA domain-containing protein [Tamaricihabitans halophyticus]|uniref:Cell wall synthesis protein Wag31 n=1 Tax=Tamaricihabitans halophyticus TaxID=1262583 RepID=A0A4R2QAY5_9PSEU|nr:DivIVA domain-containing protein [Tamaricihabitans halophyticus]TCP45414.1 DivIVA domain-containing protein [Tamaricihabitans halophyticus]